MKTLLLTLFIPIFIYAQGPLPGGLGGGGGQGFVYTGALSGIPGTCTAGQISFITDATPGQNIYEAVGTGPCAWTQQLNSGAGGASTALDNLAASNINTSLLAQTGVDLGSAAKAMRNLYFWGTGTYGTTSMKLTGVPTAARVWTFPDASDTIMGLATAGTVTNKSIVVTQLTGTLAAGRMPALTGDATSSAGAVATTVVALNGTNLAGLATGIVKNTTSTGVPSIAVAGDFPTLNQNTSGLAATATALATTPTKCSAGNYPLGVDTGGNAQNCTTASGSGTVTHTVGALTNLSLMAGAGTADSKVTNIVTDSGLNNVTLPAGGILTAPGGTSTGTTPPSLTAGTGGAEAEGEGTAPSVCAAASVYCRYVDSTQHGPLSSRNNGSYLPEPQGPASTTSGHVATWNSTNGGLLADLATTGSGNAVLAGSPTLVTPTLGVATATTVNKVTLTAPATGSTLTIADGKTLTASNTLTLAGTDSTTMTFPSTSATIARTDAANTFTGHQTIEGVATAGATGTGNLVFATSPTLTTAVLGSSTATTQSADDNSTKLATTAYVDRMKTRALSFTMGDVTNSSALTTSNTTYFTVPYACTISAWNLAVDAGTITVDVWKIATGTAIPTVSNTITASALPAIASGTALHSTTLTGWTTAVTANDIIAAHVNTVATAKFVNLVVQCDQ